MAGSPKQLTAHQIGRIKSELAEVIIANFCYPSFFDYRVDALRTRPVDRRKRQEVWAYINSLPFGPLSPADVNTIEFRRFVERVFLRSIEINRGLIGAGSPRRVTVARSRVAQFAVTFIKDLNDFLTVGDASMFGQARLLASWGSVQGQSEPTWEQIERGTQLLQTTLVYLYENAPKRASAARGDEHAGEPLPAREALTPVVGDVSQAVPVAPKGEEETQVARISAMPTHLLAPSAGQQMAAEAAHSVSRPVLGSRGNDEPYGTVPLDLASAAAPAPRRQFLPLSRPITASRPVGTPPPLPGAARPAPAIQDAPRPLPALTNEGAEAAALPATGADAWLKVLHEVSTEEAAGPAQRDAPASGVEAPGSAGQVDSTLALEQGVGSAVGPFGADLPDLPESFPAAPALMDLPPDLAELYGDYLRDSRAGVIAPELPAEPERVGVSLELLERGPGTVYNLGAPLELAEGVEGAGGMQAQALPPMGASGEPWQAAIEGERAVPLPTPLPAAGAEEPGALEGGSPGIQTVAAVPPAALLAVSPALPELAPAARDASEQEEDERAGDQQEGDAVAQPARSASPHLEALASTLLAPRPSIITTPLAPQITRELAELPAAALTPGEQAISPGGQTRPEQVRPEQVCAEEEPGAGTNDPLPALSLLAVPEHAGREMSEADVLIFVQLQHQVSTWVKIAAVSHQIEITGQDIPGLVAELRRVAALEEAELQVIESLVALCQRVATTRQATMEDYKQAMMLYLLHHRSRLAL